MKNTRDTLILVLNCGSSSIKFAVYDAGQEPLPRRPVWNGKAEGTRGRKLLEGVKELKIHGHWRPIRAEVAELPMLPAHTDSDGLLRWLSGFQRPPRHVFVVHGEASASEALRERIARELGWSVSVPRQDETHYL